MAAGMLDDGIVMANMSDKCSNFLTFEYILVSEKRNYLRPGREHNETQAVYVPPNEQHRNAFQGCGTASQIY
jgi:hypothetical protein